LTNKPKALPNPSSPIKVYLRNTREAAEKPEKEFKGVKKEVI